MHCLSSLHRISWRQEKHLKATIIAKPNLKLQYQHCQIFQRLILRNHLQNEFKCKYQYLINLAQYNRFNLWGGQNNFRQETLHGTICTAFSEPLWPSLTFEGSYLSSPSAAPFHPSQYLHPYISIITSPTAFVSGHVTGKTRGRGKW